MDNSALPTTTTTTTLQLTTQQNTTTATTTPAPKPMYKLSELKPIELKAPWRWNIFKDYEETYEHFISNLQGPHQT